MKNLLFLLIAYSAYCLTSEDIVRKFNLINLEYSEKELSTDPCTYVVDSLNYYYAGTTSRLDSIVGIWARRPDNNLSIRKEVYQYDTLPNGLIRRNEYMYDWEPRDTTTFGSRTFNMQGLEIEYMSSSKGLGLTTVNKMYNIDGKLVHNYCVCGKENSPCWFDYRYILNNKGLPVMTINAIEKDNDTLTRVYTDFDSMLVEYVVKKGKERVNTLNFFNNKKQLVKTANYFWNTDMSLDNLIYLYYNDKGLLSKDIILHSKILGDPYIDKNTGIVSKVTTYTYDKYNRLKFQFAKHKPHEE